MESSDGRGSQREAGNENEDEIIAGLPTPQTRQSDHRDRRDGTHDRVNDRVAIAARRLLFWNFWKAGPFSYVSTPVLDDLRREMIGITAFCPKTGAQLSDQRHYDERGIPLRVPVADEFVDETELDGELTTGAISSSRRALLVHFRRIHQFYRPENAELYRNVALWLRRLKQAASGSQSSDMIVWLALTARMRQEQYEAEWMVGHVSLQCPRCHGRLKYDQFGSKTLYTQCATNCTDDHADRLSEIENLAADLYAQAFGHETKEVSGLLGHWTRVIERTP